MRLIDLFPFSHFNLLVIEAELFVISSCFLLVGDGYICWSDNNFDEFENDVDLVVGGIVSYINLLISL